jgi:hypothetical protein
MRYEARFRNGYWTLFDRSAYASVDTFATKEYAQAAAQEANAKGGWRLSLYAIFEHPWRLAGA